MFSLMDKVPNGIEPMLKDLEDHIMNAGLADMVASAETITTVSIDFSFSDSCIMDPVQVRLLVYGRFYANALGMCETS